MALELPPIGLGVYKAGDAVYDAVRYALEIGYRHVDCAKIYGNEAWWVRPSGTAASPGRRSM